MVKPKKIYYIEQVLEETSITEEELKLIEEEGLIEVRIENNVRYFFDEDIERLKLIKRLKDELDINLPGIDVILNLRNKIIEMQNNFLSFIQMLKKELENEKKYLMEKQPDDILLKKDGKIEPFKKD